MKKKTSITTPKSSKLSRSMKNLIHRIQSVDKHSNITYPRTQFRFQITYISATLKEIRQTFCHLPSQTPAQEPTPNFK